MKLFLLLIILSSLSADKSYRIPFNTPLNVENTDILIVGAGLSGLTTALLLKKKDPQKKIAVLEKRGDFTRNNVINLTEEVESVLTEIGILEEFQARAASLIREHLILEQDDLVDGFNVSEVTHLHSFPGIIHLDHIGKYFLRSGKYSVIISKLQSFLTEKAQEFGVPIYKGEFLGGNVLADSNGEHFKLRPETFKIVTTGRPAQSDLLVNTNHPCHKETWVFGNLKLNGLSSAKFPKSFVTGTFGENILTNNIFYMEEGEIFVNIAVKIDSDQKTFEENTEVLLSQANFIVDLMISRGNLQVDSEREELKVINQSNPVVIYNGFRKIQFSKEERILYSGDASGVSSPLAGLGGTLSISLHPVAVEKFFREFDYEQYEIDSRIIVSAWLTKASSTKGIIENLKKKKDSKAVNEI